MFTKFEDCTDHLRVAKEQGSMRYWHLAPGDPHDIVPSSLCGLH